MNSIYVPTAGPKDWRRLLADPDKQWRTGYSARCLAYCWESARGFPREVARLFSQSGAPAFQGAKLLLAMPEFRIGLPPYEARASQNDLLVLAKGGDGALMTVAVEGKVDESFGPTLEKWNRKASLGKTERLEFIKKRLGLPDNLPPNIRYQLLHRTVSAVLAAERFNAPNAVVLVHSFSQKDCGIADYRDFLKLFGIKAPEAGKLQLLIRTKSTTLYSGWVRGDKKHLKA